MKAIGYIRVSTQRQAAEGISLEAQEKAIRSYCETYDLELLEVIEDAGVSAKTVKRPGMDRLREMVHAREIEAIVIYKIDRAFRGVREALEVIDEAYAKDVHFHSVTDRIDNSTAVGRGILNVILSFAQMERELIGERTRFALQKGKQSPGGNTILDYRRSAGKLVTGQAPFGYRWAKENGRKALALVSDPEEMLIVNTIREQSAFGLKPSQIKRILEERGMKPRNQRAWHPTQISRIIKAEYYLA